MTNQKSCAIIILVAENTAYKNADMAELADALASGASPRKGVEVQVLLSAPCFHSMQQVHICLRKRIYADMAELADALASGASPRKGVEVQVLLSAPRILES